MTPAHRFWSKVDKPDKSLTNDGCWEWQAARLRRANGSLSYGVIGWNGRSTGAHRVAWELTFGPIPTGMWVLHHCDNQGCVRPSHLYLGTHADNTRDAVRRRRMAFGEQTWNHKLREVDIKAIRALGETGFATEQIGALFHVSERTIRYVLSGEHWDTVA